MALSPVLIDAVVMMLAIEWLYPASTGALVFALERTHSSQLSVRIRSHVIHSGIAEVTTLVSISDNENSFN